ncbi:MAG TPA: hypothetical protein VMJ30_10845, partial [Gemmatimonadales bacterium]|nr:hypothetical protein [Gemmatimonadales bacterium]
QPDRFLGRWQLIPELSLYEFGPVPTSGEYRIARQGKQLEVSIGWTMADGAPRTTSFAAPDDGSWQAYEGPGAETFTLTRIDECTLDSAAFRAGRSIGYARRVASKDGGILVVVQDGAKDDGEKFRNFQVYRRAG